MRTFFGLLHGRHALRGSADSARRSFWPARARFVALSLLALGTCAAPPARAVVVEKVVATVGERPILKSERDARARPLKLMVLQRYPPGAPQAAANSQVARQTLDDMIVEELERKAAVADNLSVTNDEIDKAIERNARNQSLTSAQLIAAAGQSGLSEPQYRDMVRRQLLEFKLMQVKVVGQIRITEDDLKSEYRKAVIEARKTASVHLAWIVIHLPPSLTPAAAAKKRALAETLADRARQGADFAALARRYSEDGATAGNGGLLPAGVPGTLPAAIDRTALELEVGGTSPQFRIGEDLAVIKVVQRDAVNVPPYEQARGALQQQVWADKMEVARRRWIESLKKRTHIEVRD